MDEISSKVTSILDETQLKEPVRDIVIESALRICLAHMNGDTRKVTKEIEILLNRLSSREVDKI